MERSELPNFRDYLRWQWERLRSPGPPDPPPEDIPREVARPGRPRADAGELRVTWLGHASFLIQIGGHNLLTDPILGPRASPVSWAGPARLAPPGLRVEELPPVDAVLLSHDHFDHLDRPTVLDLRRRFGDHPTWITPPGYRTWFQRVGVANVQELRWWTETDLSGLRIQALPAQHWSRRGFRINQRDWGSWGVRDSATGRSLYFGGDSGYFPGFREIGERAGPFQAQMLPIGAYEPRWFMKYAHMNPEDAVRAYCDLGGTGAFLGMHWGTFRLTDEHPLEPPERARAAWRSEGLPEEDLHLPGIGGTVIL